MDRITWIDWAKAAGIVLVVYSHIPGAALRNAVFLFHMPLWFILSGYLYKERKLKEEACRCFMCLFVPSLIYNGALLIITPPPYRFVNQ